MGCSDAEGDGTATSDDGGDPGVPAACADSSQPLDTFELGIEKTGTQGLVTTRLIATDPVPPGRGTNQWTLQVVDPTDAPMADASVVSVVPYMFDHGHGAFEAPIAGAMSTNGEVVIETLEFHMPGVWTVTIDIDTPSGLDQVAYSFCIDG